MLGRGFSHALLQAVAGLDEPALRAALDRLADAELLFVEGVAPHANYRFKHALIQDAAYDSLLKSRRHHDAGRLAADAGERFELLALAWYVSAEAIDEIARAIDDVLRLHPKEAGRTDDVLNVRLARASEFLRRRIFCEEDRRGHVDARIGGLRRENDGDE